MVKKFYKCLWCQESISGINAWLSHTRRELKKHTKLDCIACGKKFKNQYIFGVHLMRRECLRNYPKDSCRYCKKLFVTKATCRQHEIDVCLKLSKVIEDGNNIFTKEQSKQLDGIVLNI